MNTNIFTIFFMEIQNPKDLRIRIFCSPIISSYGSEPLSVSGLTKHTMLHNKPLSIL